MISGIRVPVAISIMLPEIIRIVGGRAVERQFVRIVEGPFAGRDAELVSADGPRLTARVPVSGRQTT
ncbi:hypothetical protein AB0J43_43790, partial [Nonomuraea fuscirosea]